VLAGCNPQAPQPSPGPSTLASPAPTSPALHVTGHGTAAQPVRIVQQTPKGIEYELIALSYESWGAQGKRRSVFAHSRVNFRGEGSSTLTATAPQAILDESTNTVTLVDGVHAQNSAGMTLLCDRLVYNHATQMLHGSGHVTIIDPKGFRATGSSFDSDVSLTHMQMR
jgi:LPS export ABC transporter protein LptC